MHDSPFSINRFCLIWFKIILDFSTGCFFHPFSKVDLIFIRNKDVLFGWVYLILKIKISIWFKKLESFFTGETHTLQLASQLAFPIVMYQLWSVFEYLAGRIKPILPLPYPADFYLDHSFPTRTEYCASTRKMVTFPLNLTLLLTRANHLFRP